MNWSATLNGDPASADITATSSLLDLLRSLGLTGTKEGCRIGVCGLCTVLVDGLPVSSCIYLAACAEGADVWTVEGISRRDPDLVDAFVSCEGMQCGICTPGQVVTAAAAAEEVRAGGRGAEQLLDEEGLRRYLSGNLCRCTGYNTIIEAVGGYLAR